MKKTLLPFVVSLCFGGLQAQEAPAPAVPAAPTAPETPAAADAAAAPKASDAFKTPLEKQSYALGLNMAAQLKRGTPDLKSLNLEEVMKGVNSITKGTQSEDFVKGISFGLFLKQSSTEYDEATLLMAIKDSLSGETSKLTDSETRTELMSLQNALQAKNQAKADAAAAKNLSEATAFLAKNGKEEGVVTTPDGLQYKILKDAPQGGRLKEGDIAEVMMASFDTDGNRLDKGMEGKTRKMSQTINKGFAEAMKLMTIGSKYKLWIPPSLGFGEQGRPGMKPNSLLIYEVELLAALEPPTKATSAPATPGAPGQPGAAKPAPISATTPPVAVEMPAGGGAPKVTPVPPVEQPKAEQK